MGWVGSMPHLDKWCFPFLFGERSRASVPIGSRSCGEAKAAPRATTHKGKTHDLIAAPFFLMTSLHLSFNFKNMFMATFCAFFVFNNALTRAFVAIFPKAGRRHFKSSKSFMRICRRTQAQYISIGLRSGDRRGTCRSSILLDL